MTRRAAVSVDQPSPAPPVTVLTWNVQNASRERTERQVAWIAASTADVVILTEIPKADSGLALTQGLQHHGFTSHALDAGGDNGVLLGTRTGRLDLVEEISCTGFPHRFLAGRLARLNGTVMGVAGLYVPSRGAPARRNVDKRAFQNAVTALLPTLHSSIGVRHPLIVGGDLNVIEPGHVPGHRNFGVWEYDFYRTFAAAGLLDAFRLLNPHKAEHSWYGRRSGAGYRFDHLFLSAAHAPRLAACWYDHSPRRQGLSDHSAMLLVLR